MAKSAVKFITVRMVMLSKPIILQLAGCQVVGRVKQVGN